MSQQSVHHCANIGATKAGQISPIVNLALREHLVSISLASNLTRHQLHEFILGNPQLASHTPY
jgi:hypothetical protein